MKLRLVGWSVPSPLHLTVYRNIVTSHLDLSRAPIQKPMPKKWLLQRRHFFGSVHTSLCKARTPRDDQSIVVDIYISDSRALILVTSSMYVKLQDDWSKMCTCPSKRSPHWPSCYFICPQSRLRIRNQTCFECPTGS